MKRLHALVGGEHELAETARDLRSAIRALGPTAVGGFQITCSDECEHECTDAFERGFALELLPRLKYGERVPFRSANLGARYEWGAVRIAAAHYATKEAKRGFLALVVKINSHVSVTETGDGGVEFGHMDRYGRDDVYCGAIDAALGDSTLPFAEDLRADLLSEGQDRLAALRGECAVGGGRQALFGALAMARLQARKCTLDIEEFTSPVPTLYVVVHAVSLNKPGLDTELVGGLYVLDHRTAKRHDRYHGLGDDPTRYALTIDGGRLHVTDPTSGRERPVRDHRALAARRLAGLPGGVEALRTTAREVLATARPDRAPSPGAANRAALQTALTALATTSPVAASLLLAAHGAAALHEVRKLHLAVDPDTQERFAREVVDAVRDRIDCLPADVADRVLAALRRDPVDVGPR